MIFPSAQPDGNGASEGALPPDAAIVAAHLDEDQQDLALVERIKKQAASKTGSGLSAHVHHSGSEAWRELLTRYQSRLFGVCVRMIGASPRSRQTASDLCQDAMVKIIAGLHSFDGSSKLSTWMIRVTMNVCLSHLRGQKLRNHASLEQTGPIGKSGGADEPSGREVFAKLMESREPASGLRVLRDEMRAKLVAGLATLEDSHRAVLILRDVQGLEYAQIGQVLDLPVGTVKSRLFRARLALRAAVDEAGKPAGQA